MVKSDPELNHLTSFTKVMPESLTHVRLKKNIDLIPRHPSAFWKNLRNKRMEDGNWYLKGNTLVVEVVLAGLGFGLRGPRILELKKEFSLLSLFYKVNTVNAV